MSLPSPTSAEVNPEALTYEEALGLKPDESEGAPWPAPLNADAYHGLVGEIVRIIDPHSEADPAAVLFQFLTAFGSAVGRSAGFEAESTFHGTNLYTLVVGRTSKGRKGSSWGQARRPVELADETWRTRIASGISSGEGLIHAVRDPIESRRKAKKAEENDADEDGFITEVTDEGENDKRVLAYESEFASVLRVMRREGSTTGMVIRQAWESGELRTLTRNSPLQATGAHLSIVGHIVQEELKRELLSTDTANGFANRFLFACATRSKSLPEGGNLTDADWAKVVPRIQEALRFGSVAGVLRRNADARELWAEMYGPLSEGHAGLFGAVTSRAEAQVMRLAIIYAVLDQSSEVKPDHLRAGLAVWNYSAASALYLFGDSLGDDTADTLLKELRRVGNEGLTRTAIRDLFGRNKSGAEIDRALKVIKGLGLAEPTQVKTDGRPAELWVVAPGSHDINDLTDQSAPEGGLGRLNRLGRTPTDSENGVSP